MSEGPPQRSGDWDALERPAPSALTVAGVAVRDGSRVRLRPRPGGGDLWSVVLDGRTAVVEGIEQDVEGQVQLAVTIEDDPGRDLGARGAGAPAHRFFFAPDEVEPLGPDDPAPARGDAPPRPARVLVAGIGNVFLGDDGFGVVLADRLARRPLPAGVEVVDYGIRGMDLAYAMLDGWDAVVLLDAAPRGEPPGTVSLIEPEVDADAVAVETHGMDPVAVLAMVQALGGRPPRTLVVGCEPLTRMSGDDDVVAQLSEPVRGAIDAALRLVGDVLDDLTTKGAT